MSKNDLLLEICGIFVLGSNTFPLGGSIVLHQIQASDLTVNEFLPTTDNSNNRLIVIFRHNQTNRFFSLPTELHGIHEQATVGFLTLMESLRYCKVCTHTNTQDVCTGLSDL